MTTIDKSGTSIEDIISAFRKEHNIQDWELKYEILKKPSNGIFGLFASKVALVRFQLPDIMDRARLFTQSLLGKMGVGFDSIHSKLEGKTLYLEIVGCKDTGFLIGKNGSMLESIQCYINRVFEYDRKLEKIYLDADGYRERKEAMFFRQYLPQISKIKVHGKPLTLDPMSAGERRIIHRHVERDKGLRTLTIGEGEKKRIVIFSSRQSEKDVLSQSKADKGKPADKAPETKTDKPAVKKEGVLRPNNNTKAPRKPQTLKTDKQPVADAPQATKPVAPRSRKPYRRPNKPKAEEPTS